MTPFRVRTQYNASHTTNASSSTAQRRLSRGLRAALVLTLSDRDNHIHRCGSLARYFEHLKKLRWWWQSQAIECRHEKTSCVWARVQLDHASRFDFKMRRV